LANDRFGSIAAKASDRRSGSLDVQRARSPSFPFRPVSADWTAGTDDSYGSKLISGRVALPRLAEKTGGGVATTWLSAILDTDHCMDHFIPGAGKG
jgi:hypothetical protein